MTDKLLMKWGTMAAWNLESDAARAAGETYLKSKFHSMGALDQHDSYEQKTILCGLIDAVDGEIVNSESGETLSKEKAKTYVLEPRPK